MIIKKLVLAAAFAVTAFSAQAASVHSVEVVASSPTINDIASGFFGPSVIIAGPMLFEDRPDLPSPVNVFTDCGLVIDPSAEELADIAISSAESMRCLTGLEPKIAMLSFSTRGSAKHASVTKVSEATALLQIIRFT